LKKTKFLPGQKDGRAVNSQITIKVKFEMEEKSKFAVSGIKRMQNVSEDKSRDNSQVPATKTEETTETKKEIKDYTNFRCDLDVCPKPKGGLQTIIDNLVIPPTAKRLKINGEVIIIATVDEYGIVRDTKVEKSLGYGCDEAAEVALFDTEFEPGIKNGNPVRGDVRIIVPISQDKKK
jgi:TonB family protein